MNFAEQVAEQGLEERTWFSSAVVGTAENSRKDKERAPNPRAKACTVCDT